MSSEDLEQAASSGYLESVRQLIKEEGVDVNSRFNDNNTALHRASIHGHVEIVQFLLDNHADVNASDGMGNTPLHMACSRAGNIRVVQLLIDYKADVTKRAEFDKTALHCAIKCFAGLDVVCYLLDHKAAANATDIYGNAPLHYARDIETVQCLLDHDADVNIADKWGRTPLHGGRQPVSAPVAELLLSHGANIHAKDKELRTPLHTVVANSSVAGVRVLLDHLSSSHDPASTESALMCRTKYEQLPFHYVRSAERAKLLLERPLMQDEDQVVPRVCLEMLFAKDSSGLSLIDRFGVKDPAFDYLKSFTDFPLTVVPVPTTAVVVPSCEHRDKKRRHATVPFNPTLNEFQRSIAKAFLNKWDQSFQRARTTADQEDVHAMLPDDLKYVIMAYMTPADIMKI